MPRTMKRVSKGLNSFLIRKKPSNLVVPTKFVYSTTHNPNKNQYEVKRVSSGDIVVLNHEGKIVASQLDSMEEGRQWIADRINEHKQVLNAKLS